MIPRIMALAVSLASMANATLAQDYDGVVSLGYRHVDVEDLGTGFSILFVDGKFDAKFASGFSLGGDVSLNNFSIDDVSENTDVTSLGFNAAYHLANGFNFGGYAERSAISVNSMNLDLSATSYGIMAGYAVEGLTLSGFVGATNTDPELPDGVDLTDLGLIVGYQATPELMVGASYVRSELSDGDDSIRLQTYGLAAAYGINDDLTVFGGLGRSTLSNLDLTLTTLGLGVSYDLARLVKLPAFASFEMTRSMGALDEHDSNIDSFRFAVTFPLGGSSAKVPLTSVASDIMNPRHNAITSVILTNF